MASGFKIADAFVEIDTKDNTQKDIKSVTKRLADIDDKVIQVTADDKATRPILSLTKIDIPDKRVGITANDNATEVIDRVDSETIDSLTVPIRADDQASDVIDKVSKKKPQAVTVPVEAEDKTSGDLAAIGGKMKGWAVGLGLGTLIGGALLDGLKRTNLTAHFQNQMGVTADIAKQAGETASQVFAQGFTKDRSKISAAISSLSSDVKNWSSLTQEEQSKISGGAVKIAEVYGKDINEVLKASSSMVSNGLTPSFRDSFDVITRGLQSAGSRGDDLLETLTEYSGYFKDLGLDAETSLGIMIQMMQAGARDTDYAADAIKEFGIKVLEVGGTAEDGFEALGLDARKMADEFGAGGERARQAFNLTVKGLQDMKDPVDRNTAGVALFGTQWEDTMKRILPNLDTAATKLDNVAGATDRLVSEMTAVDKVEAAWDTMISGIAEGMVGLAQGIRNVLQLDPGSSTIDKMIASMREEIRKTSEEESYLSGVTAVLNNSVSEMGIEAGFTGGKTRDLTAAIKEMSDTVLAAVNKDLSFRQSVQQTKDAQENLVSTLKKHKPTSDEAIQAGFQLESAQIRQAQAAKELAVQNSKSTDEVQRNTEGSRAYSAEVIKMAQAANGNGTPALRTMIGKLSEADLAAAGATRTIDGAGNAVIRLPGGKEIKVNANDLASPVINDVAKKDYKATVDVVIGNIGQAVDAVRRALSGFGLRFNEGGRVSGPGTSTSDSIPAMLSDDEYVIRAKQYKANQGLVEAINEGDGPVRRFAGGGPVGSGAAVATIGTAPAASTTYVTNVYAGPDVDINALAARVGRQLEIQRRNRG